MKVSQKKVEELLKAIGLTVEVVEDGSKDAEEFDIDANISLIDANRSAVIKPQITDEMKSELESGFKSRLIGSIKSAFNRNGIKINEDLTTADDLIKKALELHSEKYSKDTEGLRDEIKKLTDEHNASIQQLNEKYDTDLNAEKAKFIDRDIDELLHGFIKEIPRNGGDEFTQARQVKQWLRENYHIHYDPEGKKVELRDKANHEQPIYNEQKTKLKEVKDVVKEWADKIGISASDTRHQNALNAMNNKTTGAVIEKGTSNKEVYDSHNILQSNDAILKDLMGD